MTGKGHRRSQGGRGWQGQAEEKAWTRCVLGRRVSVPGGESNKCRAPRLEDAQWVGGIAKRPVWLEENV